MTGSLARAVRLFLLPFLLAPVAPALAADLFFHVAGCLTDLGGEIADDLGSSQSSHVDLDHDIGFGSDAALDLRLGSVGGRHRFQAAGAIFDNEVRRADAAFRFRGVEFEADAHVTSKLRWVEGEYGFALMNQPKGRVEILGGVRYMDYAGEVEGRQRFGPIDVIASADASASGPVPHLGLLADIRPFQRLVFRGYAKGLFLGIGDDRGEEIDLEATVGFRIFSAFELGGGFRYMNIFANLDDSETTIDLAYRSVTAYVRFGK